MVEQAYRPDTTIMECEENVSAVPDTEADERCQARR